jgi:hypothetical protein
VVRTLVLGAGVESREVRRRRSECCLWKTVVWAPGAGEEREVVRRR